MNTESRNGCNRSKSRCLIQGRGLTHSTSCAHYLWLWCNGSPHYSLAGQLGVWRATKLVQAPESDYASLCLLRAQGKVLVMRFLAAWIKNVFGRQYWIVSGCGQLARCRPDSALRTSVCACMEKQFPKSWFSLMVLHCFINHYFSGDIISEISACSTASYESFLERNLKISVLLCEMFLSRRKPSGK